MCYFLGKKKQLIIEHVIQSVFCDAGDEGIENTEYQ